MFIQCIMKLYENFINSDAFRVRMWLIVRNINKHGGRQMEALLWVNWIAFLAITIYAAFLFVQVVRTRIAYIKLGRKSEYDQDVKQRLKDIWVYVFGQKKLLKDMKSGIIHVMMFYGFLLVQFGAIDYIWKGLNPESHLPFGIFYPGFVFFQEIVTLTILVAVVWLFIAVILRSLFVLNVDLRLD